jgi:phospholipid/cholesterol/gamma-HCH transport system permease protein
MTELANITLEHNTLVLKGDWTLQSVQWFPENPLAELTLPTFPIIIDASQITELDSAGAYLINKFFQQLRHANVECTIQGLTERQQLLCNRINSAYESVENIPKPIHQNVFEKLGRLSADKCKELIQWLSFIGEFSIISSRLFLKPWNIPWKSIIATLDFTGVRALPIIAFLSLLIGVVLTYQIGLQLEYYGANIYIVNFLGLGILREFGPLLAAIILAGRTSSSYTAQLGLMKSNEEIDALKTMGISPTEILIFPKILGLMLAMPLLTVWSDIFGLLGGMFMSKISLSVNYQVFLEQFPQVITISSFVIGLVKAPVFAFIIASVGCYHGMKVSGSALSIGQHTTKSVVLAIFLIIIADAIFSVVLSYLGI